MPALPPAIPTFTSAAVARRMTSDDDDEGFGDDSLSPDTVKLSAGLAAATSVEDVLEAADNVVRFAGFGSVPAAAPSIVCDAVSFSDRLNAFQNDVFKMTHKLFQMLEKVQSEKALLRQAGKRALEAASEAAAQLARAQAENEHLRGLLHAYRRLDGGKLERDLCWSDAYLCGDSDTVARVEQAEADAANETESESESWDEELAVAEQLATSKARGVA